MYATVSYISLDLLYIHKGDEPSENCNKYQFPPFTYVWKYFLHKIWWWPVTAQKFNDLETKQILAVSDGVTNAATFRKRDAMLDTENMMGQKKRIGN